MLIHNWKKVLIHAWSIRLIVLAAVLSGIEIVIPLMPTFVEIPPGYFAGASFVVTVAAFVARLTAQQSVSGGRNDSE